MLFFHPYLIEAKQTQSEQLGIQLKWPQKPHSSHSQYFILNSPRLPASLGVHFHKALDACLPKNYSVQQLKEVLLQVISSASEELPNKELLLDVLTNPEDSWVLASFTSFGTSLAMGGRGRVYHLVRGTKWQFIQPEKTTARGGPEWEKNAFIAAEKLTAGNYLLLTVSSVPAEFMEPSSTLLSEKTKQAPYKRAEKASELLLQTVPGAAAYLIDILSSSPRSERFELKNVLPKAPKMVKAAPAVPIRSKRWVFAVAISVFATGVFLFQNDFTKEQAPGQANKKYNTYESNAIRTNQAREFVSRSSIEMAETKRAAHPKVQSGGLVKSTAFNGLVVKRHSESNASTSNSLFQKIREARAIRLQGKALYDKSLYAAAFGNYLRAAQQGDKYAQFYLGLMYIKGLGTSRDSTRGLMWIEQAAGQSLLPAQQMLYKLKPM